MFESEICEWGRPWLYIYSGSRTVCVYARVVTGLEQPCTLRSKTRPVRVESTEGNTATKCFPVSRLLLLLLLLRQAADQQVTQWHLLLTLCGGVGEWLVRQTRIQHVTEGNFCSAQTEEPVMGEVEVAAEHPRGNPLSECIPLHRLHDAVHSWAPDSQPVSHVTNSCSLRLF